MVREYIRFDTFVVGHKLLCQISTIEEREKVMFIVR